MKHEEDDGLSPLLHEWQSPEPSRGMDAKMLALYRHRHPPRADWWARIWSAQITVPVPALAALLVLVMGAAVWLRRPPEHAIPSTTTVDGYIT